MKLNLVLDEIVANVIRYGHTNDGEHEIGLSLALDGPQLAIEVTDDGVAFNPIAKVPPIRAHLLGEGPESLGALDLRRVTIRLHSHAPAPH